MDTHNIGHRLRNRIRPTESIAQFHLHCPTEGSEQAIGLTKEQYFGHRNFQKFIGERIEAIASKLANTPESTDETHEDEINSVVNPLVSDALFDLLIQEGLLPKIEGDKRIVHEPLANAIVLRVVSSPCHDYTAALFWAASGGIRNTLKIGRGACAK